MTAIHHRCGIVALLIVGLCIVPGFNAVSAQLAPGPIILTTDGDLWAWNGVGLPLTQLTSWGRNGGPVLSPDGTRAAYTSISSIWVDWAQRQTGGGGGYARPENIWMLDIPSGHTYRIADQPADAVWDGPNNPGRYIMRSPPAWSPDGQRLAWVELPVDMFAPINDPPADTAQLVVHDLVSGIDEVLASFPFSHSLALGAVFDVQWGRPGIAVKSTVGSLLHECDLYIFDLAGNTITQLHEESNAGGVYDVVWIQDQDRDYLVNPRSSDGTWLNWRTGQHETMPGLPELYSLTAPDGASFYLSGDVWYLALPGQAPIDLGDDVRPYGIARDGQAVVYRLWEIDPLTGTYANTIMVQYAHHQVEIGRIHPAPGVVWGPVGWRVRR